MDYKIIQDPIHGSIRISTMFLDLLQTPEMQRLYGIRQLGLAYLVYPGANHTRFEHSVGAFHVAKRYAGSLGMGKEDRNLLMAAALLHDVGHGPYSHSLEPVYRQLGFGHADVSKKIITGDYDIIGPERRRFLGSRTIPDILEKNGLNPKEVAKLIDDYAGKKYLGQLIHGSIDVDRIDYLLRDAHYTGAVHGVIDLSRLLEIVRIHDNEIVFSPKGITTVEDMLLGRTLMYLSVYFHKTVIIAEDMLCRALESCLEDAGDFFQLDDADLLGFLMSRQGLPSVLANRIRFRKLFKKAFVLSAGTKVRLKRNELEKEIIERAKLPEGSVLVNMPEDSFKKEIRDLQEIKILDKTVKSINEYTKVSGFLKTRLVPDWSVLISCDEKHRELVRKTAERIL